MDNKLLLVDDEPGIANALMRHLKDAGMEVEWCDNGEEALEKIAQNDYSVILLDVLMPEFDGIAVLKEIRSDEEKYGDPKIIVITNNSNQETQDKVEALGITAFYDKGTMSATELLEKIKSLK
jgi:DNA-binding response OmpR family regulator